MFQPESQNCMHFGAEPIMLVGSPKRCVGIIQARNTTSLPLMLERLRLRTSEQLLSNCEEPEVLEIQTSAGLCAGESQALQVKLRLPAGTPPGRYAARIEGADGHACPVSIEVLERRHTRCLPAAMTCSPEPGSSVSVRLTVSNLGNVPVLIPTRVALEMHEGERGWPHHFHAAAKAHGEEGYAAFLDSFVKKLASAEPPVGRAKVVEGAGVLAPQQSRALLLEVSIPKQLHSGRKYLATLRLADAQFRMRLHVGAAQTEAQENPETPSVVG
jgi:hypothetical protein